MRDILRVGKILNTHGLKGELKVLPLTDNPRRYDDLEFVLLDGKEVKLEGCKYQKDRVILKLEGINTIEEAERLKNKYLEIPREYAVELEEDTYFIADLIGCTVYDTEGRNLGKIYDVIQTKNNDVYWIREPKELLIPVLLDIVLDINIEEEKIIIKPVGEWQDED
ncbi:ribosome maturation factor RimM [Caproiciproducens sp. MSJ-32]|uniref:ribosome maturation factor RimM n=1 Tax=Caproiciproducens sp. MSJ-32 TaxID=2841527 RepID=UPI001C11A59A|nr:ribosome maturation factor RimM [Caproiciproducens sp. MSJ-32]MBU5455763.1 ribosome maturation factor RimM [Caproiciproducens sp. MSJ-32]